MANSFYRHHINRVLLSIVLSTFAITHTVPLYSTEYSFAKNDIDFVVNIEKLMKRLIKSDKKGADEIITILVAVKREIETHYSCSLNTDYAFDQIQRECKKNKIAVPLKHLAWIKAKFIMADKKSKNKPTLVYTDYDVTADFDDNIFAVVEDEIKEDKEIPALLVYGISLTCCGVFLTIVPIPVCKFWGEKMIVAGITACANAICTAEDKKEKK
jgi:hypothetical protein